jgi:hypothetical protein
MTFICSKCGEKHKEIPSYNADRPAFKMISHRAHKGLY